jgi:hypothetical protein
MSNGRQTGRGIRKIFQKLSASSLSIFPIGKEMITTYLHNLFTKLTIGKNCSIFSNLSHLRLIEISSLPLWMASRGKEDFLNH